MMKMLVKRAFMVAMFAASSGAQTITGSGTTNTVPVFTGSSTIDNSPISVSGSNVGIGTTSPLVPLDINGYLHVSGSIAPSTTGQGAYLGWNALTGGLGEADIINNQGGGSGGFVFMNTPSSGTPLTPLMYLSGTGNLELGNYNNQTGDGNNWFGSLSSQRGYPNNFTNLFLGGALVDNGSGSYTVQTDDGSNYFAAIRMDNSGGNAGAINFYTGGSVGGSSYTITNDQLSGYARMSIVGNNVGIGTTSPAAKLEVNGNVKLTSGSGASITFPDNTIQSTAWNGTLYGGDYAESVNVIGKRGTYEPGDVIVLDPSHPGSFVKSTKPYSTTVAGIYSTKPGLTGRRQTTDRSHMAEEIPMAMIGIVPVKVSAENGPIHLGDLLVTSSTRGYAMKGSDRAKLAGAIVGKAMAELDSGIGTIEALVTLQ